MNKDDSVAEVWADVAGYKGLYKVSNLGNVMSLDRTVRERGTNKKINRKGKHLKPCFSTGYYCVGLGRDGVIKTLKIHRLVALAFVGGRTEKKCVTNHKNGDKLDNRAANLEWCTIGYNLQHAYDTGLKKGAWYPRKVSQTLVV